MPGRSGVPDGLHLCGRLGAPGGAINEQLLRSLFVTGLTGAAFRNLSSLMFHASHGVSAKKSQNDIFEIAFSVNTREREIISVHCNKKAVSMMRRAFLLLVLFFCAGSFGSAQLPSSNSGSTSDDCLTNPMSGACASQNSSQTQSSQTAGQSTLSGNPTPVDLGVSGSRQSMASPDLKSGAGDLGQPPDNNQPDQKEQADQIQRQMRSKAQLSPSSPEAENEFQNFVEISIDRKSTRLN